MRFTSLIEQARIPIYVEAQNSCRFNQSLHQRFKKPPKISTKPIK